jgi:hypothetical protein
MQHMCNVHYVQCILIINELVTKHYFLIYFIYLQYTSKEYIQFYKLLLMIQGRIITLFTRGSR